MSAKEAYAVTTASTLAKVATPVLSLTIVLLFFMLALRQESQLVAIPAALAPKDDAAATAVQLCDCSQRLVLDYFEIGTVSSLLPPSSSSVYDQF
jgi:hypothetical protein